MTAIQDRDIPQPVAGEYHEYYESYISQVAKGELVSMMMAQPDELRSLLGELSDEEVSCLHEPYTWTLKQVMGHLIDVERCFADRVIRISVGDKAPIPGMDQQEFVRAIDFSTVAMSDLLDEFSHLRAANLLALGRTSDAALSEVGTASDNSVSARANLYIMAGHVAYHFKIMRSRLTG